MRHHLPIHKQRKLVIAAPRKHRPLRLPLQLERLAEEAGFVFAWVAGEESPEEILAGAEETLLKLGEEQVKAGLVNPAQILEAYDGGISAFLDPSKRVKGCSTGFLKLAIRTGVPIVPVVSIGGQETLVVLTRGEALSQALGLHRLRLKVLPVSLVVPWGITLGDFIPRWTLPAKLTTQVLPPIDVSEKFGDDPDLDEAYDYVTGTMQSTLDALAAERRLPILG